MKKAILYFGMLFLAFNGLGQLSEVTKKYTISIFPNPVVNELNIVKSFNDIIFHFGLYNIMGDQVYLSELHNGTNTINVSEFTNGVYFYTLMNQNHILETKKIIIKH